MNLSPAHRSGLSFKDLTYSVFALLLPRAVGTIMLFSIHCSRD